MMIKRLLLTFAFVAWTIITSTGITYAAEDKTMVVSEELIKLSELYKEGVITEEEFSKAKSILLDPDAGEKKKKKKKKKLTAAERERLKEAELEEAKALKEELRAEKRAEKERAIEERRNILEEKQKACSDDPNSEDCKKAKASFSTVLGKIKLLGLEISENARKERKQEKQTLEERKKRISKEKAERKQASLEEQEIVRAEKEARTAERKKRRADWKKACSDDPESKACIDGKPSEKIKNTLKKIRKQLGG